MSPDKEKLIKVKLFLQHCREKKLIPFLLILLQKGLLKIKEKCFDSLHKKHLKITSIISKENKDIFFDLHLENLSKYFITKQNKGNTSSLFTQFSFFK